MRMKAYIKQMNNNILNNFIKENYLKQDKKFAPEKHLAIGSIGEKNGHKLVKIFDF